jgi:hypothetical protein
MTTYLTKKQAIQSAKHLARMVLDLPEPADYCMDDQEYRCLSCDSRDYSSREDLIIRHYADCSWITGTAFARRIVSVENDE